MNKIIVVLWRGGEIDKIEVDELTAKRFILKFNEPRVGRFSLKALDGSELFFNFDHVQGGTVVDSDS